MEALTRSIEDWEDTPTVTPSDINIMFLITDGRPVCSCGSSLSTCSTQPCGNDGLSTRNRIDAYNIEIIVIEVGDFNTAPIDCLADPGNTFAIPGFTEEDFQDLEDGMIFIVYVNKILLPNVSINSHCCSGCSL